MREMLSAESCCKTRFDTLHHFSLFFFWSRNSAICHGESQSLPIANKKKKNSEKRKMTRKTKAIWVENIAIVTLSFSFFLLSQSTYLDVVRKALKYL